MEKLLKITEWIPEYDIRISMDLMLKKELLKAEDYEVMLKNYKRNKSSLNDVKLSFYMNFLSLVSISTAFRYVESTYKIMNTSFPMDKLIGLIKMTENNLEFHSIFMEIYSNFHARFQKPFNQQQI